MHRVHVTLMGPPRITVSDPETPAGIEVERIKDDSDVLRLLALLILSRFSPGPSGTPALTPGLTHDVDRKWLAQNLDPALFAQDEKKARDKFSYVLKKLNRALDIRVKGDGAREYQFLEVRLGGLQIDVRKMLAAARQLEGEANQDAVIALGRLRLLDGADDAFGDTTVFAPLRATLDDLYLDALARKIAGLLLILETAMALREFEQANRARSSALPLIDQARARLVALGSPHPLAAQFDAFHARAARLLPLGEAGLPRHAIPRRITRFIGREAQMGKLKTLLGTEQVVTITGMGGCGKSRLALQAAAEHAERTDSDAWLVELAGVTDPDVLPQAVANALSLPEPKQKTVLDALIERLRPTPALLVLDNCEHLLTGCAVLVETLTQACPALTVLATSRQQINIEGECLLRLPPLRVPPADGTALDPADPLGALMQYEAARLFIDRICLNQDFVLLPEHAGAIASICVGLDGIPLALELAAARAASFSLIEIDELLTDRFHVLTNGRTTALPRHKTLRAVIDWSYDLLTERERILLGRCSVFAGGWTLDAAQSVGASGEIAESDVQDLLACLVDKSLVTAETAAALPGRYRMLETVRQYAGDRLRERGERDATRLRHWEYCLRLAEAATPDLTGSDSGPLLDRLDAEMDNLRVALAWCMADDPPAPPDRAGRALRLCNALGWFWTVRGHFSEGRPWFDQVLKRMDGAPPSSQIATALDWGGKLAWHQGAYDIALPRLETGLAMTRRLGDPIGIVSALNTLGIVMHGKGDYAASAVYLQECLERARSLGDQRRVASALNNLGTLAYDHCEYRQATAFLEESLAIFRHIDYHKGIAHALTNLGFVALFQSRSTNAQTLLNEGLERHLRMGDRQSGAYALICLGINACNRGDYDAARTFLEESRMICREIGDRHHLGYALAILGFVAYYQRDDQEACSLFQESLDLYRQIDVPRGAIPSLHGMGVLTRDRGDLEAALVFFRDGLVLARGVGDKLGVVNVLEGWAGAAAALGDTVRAARRWGAASALRDHLGTPLPANAREREAPRIAAARATLGDAAFSAAFDAGRALSWEQAVQEALDSLGDDPD